ncbi:MAG: Hpt domain-containing protein [Candidatus Omnitrophota bacterium]
MIPPRSISRAFYPGSGGDRKLLKEIIKMYTEDYPKKLRQIREGIEKSDAETVARVAHVIRGAVSNFEAKDAFEAARRLKKIGKSRDLEKAEAAFAELENKLKRLEEALEIIK